MPKEYIEREKAIELVKNYGKGAISDGMKTLDPVDDIVSIVKGFDLIPAADVVEVRHGEWKRVNPQSDVHFYCSECHTEISTSWEYDEAEMFSYCPRCGAKMDGKGEGNA